MFTRLLFTPVLFLLLSPVGPALSQQTLPADATVINWNDIPQTVIPFSKKVSETSGLIWYDDALWTFNDSGGKPELYKIDTLGNIVQTVKLSNASNVDWEDITQDDQYIYIGDFGNNLGNRVDQTIYKIAKEALGHEMETRVKAESIYISFADQKDFSIRNRGHNFDCESVTSMGDSLILFSKDWKDGHTRMYKCGKSSARYPLNPVDEFRSDGLVTGASYNPDNKTLALIGYREYVPFIWLINGFNGNSFNSENIVRINLVGLTNSQTEGICWMDDATLYISTEKRGDYKQGAYRINLPDVLNKGEKIR